MVSIDILDHDRHAVRAGAEARRGRKVVLGRWRMHPDDTVADMQLAVHDMAGLVASEGAGTKPKTATR